MASGSDSALSIPPQLLQGLFDYAGLFPPAALAMDAAVAEYVAHKTGPEAWLVGPFVVPAARLQEMEDAFATHAPTAAPEPAAAVGITLLPRSADTLQEDLHAFMSLVHRASTPFRLAAVEFRLPPHALQDRTSIDAVLDSAAAAVLGVKASRSDVPMPVYIELPRPFTSAQLATYMGGLSSRTAPPSFRAKIRCGGDSIAAYPSAGELAGFIDAAHRAGIAFKATAGLHHPFPVPDTATGATMHGFINVFTASVLHAVHVLPLATLEELLTETDRDAFSLSASHIGWRSWQASAADVHRVRRTFAMGIGSCSISEPVEDLSSLGYSIS
ncbi:MAG: hypothetical protein RIE53_11425 [Rhodothermales bacterium]